MILFSSFVIKRNLPLALIIFTLTALFFIAPYQFRSSAGSKSRVESSQKNSDDTEKIENYDIRTDKSQTETLIAFRQESNKNVVEIADFREQFVTAESALRQKVPTLKIEYNEDLRIPEIIALDAKKGSAFLSSPSKTKHSDILLDFIRQNNDLLGVSEKQTYKLKLAADYTNPDGNLSFTQFNQTVNDIPVFRGEVKAGFTKQGEMIRVINNLAPDLDYQNLSDDFGDPLTAVKKAAHYVNYQLKIENQTVNKAESNDSKTVFGNGDWATTAEKMYFPTEPGVARTAWRVLIWKPENAYYVIVDSETGEMLWRKNITNDQTQAATFSVYANPNAMVNIAHNPFPLIQNLADPTLNQQGTAISRTNITRIGNESPYPFNNNGWITDGNNTTDGNAVEAGIDRDGTNGIDAQGSAIGNPNRNFVFDYAPGNPNTNTGDVPNPTPQTYPISAFQNGAVTQLFYVCNLYHDELYRLGFTEQAGNFQQNDFGRGGAENDRISAEAQDSSGTNNANFSTPADGTRGKMQMYLWSGPTPNFDGDLDADVVIHELTHGLSNRLHGNGSGLSGGLSGAMGEGWSDFYAEAMLSSPDDPINGIYTIGSYVTYLKTNNFRSNYYYGIRRFPTAVMGFTGTNGKPHNPLSFRHLNSDCNTEIGTSTAIGSISAFPRGPSGSATCDESHAGGEIWSSALWEVRAKFISRLGWEIGNRKVLQIITDGMKLAPLNPTFLQERNAILAAAQANGNVLEAAANVADVWAGFSIRGMGFSAKINALSPANVTEAFDLPNLLQTPDFIIDDTTGNNNGFADAGEKIKLSISLSNNTGNTANDATLQIVGGGTANYGDIGNNQTVTRAVDFTVPAAQSCGSSITLTLNINSSLGAKTEKRILIVGKPLDSSGFSQNFDSVTVPAIPNDWTASAPNPNTANAAPWQTVSPNAASLPNAIFAPDVDKPYLAQLESPQIPITVSAAKLKFKINYNTESGWDGTTLDIKIGSGAYQDIVDAGGIFLAGEYNNLLSSGNFPNAGRRAWSGNSNGYVDVEIILPASAGGQNVQFRWNASADTSVSYVGTYIDDVKVISDYECAIVGNFKKPRADFDGDGKTDVSVFRPSNGNWYLNQSSNGFTALNWGATVDKLIPGDFNGDGKTDTAVFRPNYA
ncbi:MAG: M36 family metallopeptidase, partial [Acidobacteriota bacterium]